MIEQYFRRHEAYLLQLLESTDIPADKIQSAMRYSLVPAGKRIRPLLVYLTGELIQVPIDCLDVIAASIELTHCYSLIHDDLPAMDNDDYRRGKLSCHKAYDEATAILVGDGLQALAIELLLAHLPTKLPPSQVIAITQELVKASGVSGMVSGQSLDLTELSCASITESKLKQIHHLKTGRLILACIVMVLNANEGVTEATKSSLRNFATQLGLVFQIQDDYLDCYASQDALGKGRSSDAANQKTTFASLWPREQLEETIAQLYQEAILALSEFGPKAAALIQFTKTLENRSCLPKQH